MNPIVSVIGQIIGLAIVVGLSLAAVLIAAALWAVARGRR